MPGITVCCTNSGSCGFVIHTPGIGINSEQSQVAGPTLKLYVACIVVGVTIPAAIERACRIGEVRIWSAGRCRTVTRRWVGLAKCGIGSREWLVDIRAIKQVRAFVPDVIYLESGIGGQLALHR